MMKLQCLKSSPPSHADISLHLERMLSSPDFKATPQQRAFLNYVVEQTLAGNADRIKGYTVATEVFGRRSDFDQSLDPIVSIQAAGLRRALAHYYRTAGRNAPLVIDIPKGGFVPSFAQQPQAATTDSAIDAPNPDSRVQSFWPSVLIQPLDNLSGDPDLDAWGIGLAVEIAHELDRYSDIRVMTGGAGNPDTTADPQGAQFKLDGSVRGDGTWSKITVRLTDTRTGRQIWCDSRRSTIEGVRLIAFQEEIARVVAVKIAGERGLIAKCLGSTINHHPPERSEVYTAVMRYYEYGLTHTPEAFSRALTALEQATGIDAQCGQVWSMRARLYAEIHAFDIPGFDHPLDKASEFARNGLRLMPDDQRSHTVMAFVHLLENELKAGRAAAERALALGPSTLYMLDRIGYLMTLLGDWERGPALIAKIIRLNPFYGNYVHYALWANWLRQEDYACAWQETLSLNQPALFWDHLARASSLGLRGEIEKGRKAAAELLKRKPDFPECGRMLIGRFIKFEAIAEQIIQGLAAVGIEIQ